MNTFFNELKNTSNLKLTENGGVTRKTTNSKVLDLFGLGGSYRSRTEADCIELFREALQEDKTLAMRCLFYLRDVRGGQGERRFFRVCYRWLIENKTEIAVDFLPLVPEYGRWDDVIEIVNNTKLEKYGMCLIAIQLRKDLESKSPSLLAKWLPSQNASSLHTKEMGKKVAKYLALSNKEYRIILSSLRKRLNVLERLITDKDYNEIQFDKIPSRAGLKYSRFFARTEELKDRYTAFLSNKKVKMNAAVLYPYDIAHKIFNASFDTIEALQKAWDNLPDYYHGKKETGIAVVDVSGSMHGTPIEAAISMGAYIAEKGSGPFANHFITFSKNPEFVEFKGNNIVEKICNCKRANWGYNTDIHKVFNLLLMIALIDNVKPEDIPERLYIFSDMEFDAGLNTDEQDILTDIEAHAKKWEKYGYKLPKVIFWNLNARHNSIPAIGEQFTYISGFSPVMIENVLGGKSGYELMLEKLNSPRYEQIYID